MLVKETHHTVSVRPSDFDVLGHVNNAVVLEFLEMGRAHWLAENNLAVNGCVVAVVARAAGNRRPDRRGIDRAGVTDSGRNRRR